MSGPGRKKKYSSAKALQEGVNAYWNSISYEKPAVISTPTGYVDENGRIEYTTKLLTMNEDGSLNMSGTGIPKTVTEFLEPPSVAGLCIFLGISRETWSAYSKDKKLSSVCELFRLKLENYLVGRLEGDKSKSVQGVIFNLKNNFGWKDKCEVEQKGDTKLRIEMAPEIEELAE